MILDQIAAFAAERVAVAKERLPLDTLKRRAYALPTGAFLFERAIAGPGLSFICEVKKASPSKGVIDPVFDYRAIAKSYEEAGADCLSCLTEPHWFLGSDEIFRAIRAESALPMLRKDFTVDEYQLYEAKVLGADAVLLIAALLDRRTLHRYLDICQALGLSALVETHTEQELLLAKEAGARLIGINNRNLKDFSVDMERTARLRDQIPAALLAVAESGVQSPQDVRHLAETGVDALLIGEALMRASDRGAALASFRKAAAL